MKKNVKKTKKSEPTAVQPLDMSQFIPREVEDKVIQRREPRPGDVYSCDECNCFGGQTFLYVTGVAGTDDFGNTLYSVLGTSVYGRKSLARLMGYPEKSISTDVLDAERILVNGCATLISEMPR